MTPREFELRQEAYDRMDYAVWQKIRVHAFKTISVHLDQKSMSGFDIFEWFPIPGDPTGVELKKMNEERKVQEAVEFKKIYDERITAIHNMGL